jgi:hypothetical protein
MVLRNVGKYPKTQRHIQQDSKLANKSLTTLYIISYMHTTRLTYLIVLDSSQIVNIKALQLVRQTDTVISEQPDTPPNSSPSICRFLRRVGTVLPVCTVSRGNSCDIGATWLITPGDGGGGGGPTMGIRSQLRKRGKTGSNRPFTTPAPIF